MSKRPSYIEIERSEVTRAGGKGTALDMLKAELHRLADEIGLDRLGVIRRVKGAEVIGHGALMPVEGGGGVGFTLTIQHLSVAQWHAFGKDDAGTLASGRDDE